MFRRWPAYIGLILSLAAFPTATLASVEITEVMYNPEGADSGREWIELKNTGGSTINLDSWRFREDETDHLISTSSQSNHTKSPRLSPGEFIILTDDPGAFSADYPDVSAVLDSAFSLVNSGEKLSMVNPDGSISGSVNYDTSIGGDNNGNSLQRTDNGWITAPPTPAEVNANQSDPKDESGNNDDDNNTESSQSSSGSTVQIMQPREGGDDEKNEGEETEDDKQIETDSSSEPKKTITVNAGPDIQTIAGVQVHMAGSVTSSAPELLDDRTIRWSLGNGDTKSGADVFYTYDHPDTYTATLMVKNDTRVISDQINVVVSSPELSIASTSAGSDGFIKIANDLNRDVNLAGWHLRTVDGIEMLPDYTIVPAQDSLTISNQGTGFTRVAQAALLYPDGTVADRHQPTARGDDNASGGDTTTTESRNISTSEDVTTDSGDPTGQSTTSQGQSLNELFTTSSQQAAAGQTSAGFHFWRWAGLLVLVVAAGVGVVMVLRRFTVTANTEDKLAETFNINEM